MCDVVCYVMCDFVCDVACDGVQCCEGSGKVEWLIISNFATENDLGMNIHPAWISTLW